MLDGSSFTITLNPWKCLFSSAKHMRVAGRIRMAMTKDVVQCCNMHAVEVIYISTSQAAVLSLHDDLDVEN